MIKNGKMIAAELAADFLIAASVSNWGGYALAAASACVKYDDTLGASDVEGFLGTSGDEEALLERCVSAGCRDGVSGKMEATVDGMPLCKSQDCLEAIRKELHSFKL